MKNKFLFFIGKSFRKIPISGWYRMRKFWLEMRQLLKGSILAQNAEKISSDLCPAESFYDPSIGSYQQPLSEEVLQQVCKIPATGYAIKACMSYCKKGQFQFISKETCYRAQTIKDLGNILKEMF